MNDLDYIRIIDIDVGLVTFFGELFVSDDVDLVATYQLNFISAALKVAIHKKTYLRIIDGSQFNILL